MKYFAYCTKDYKNVSDIIEDLADPTVYCDWGVLFADSIDELKDAVVEQIKERAELECCDIDAYNYNIAKIAVDDEVGYVQLSYKVCCNVFDC